MAESNKPAVAKVVTGNKVMTSILHGLTPLIPPGLNSAKPKGDLNRNILLDAIEDDTTWFSYIKGTKDGKLLEEACSLFPNYWKAHHRLALYHLYNKRTRRAFEVYTKAMKTNDEYHLHVWYLKFLYHMASIHEYIAALLAAIEKVGLDHRSEPLWKETITIMVKIYNCNLMEKNIQTGFLPNLFPSELIINTGGGPLMPSDAEHIVFRGVNTLDPKEQTYLQLYSEVNNIRKLFQRWLRIPTNNLKHAWEGYSTFENIASAANVLASKLLADAKTWYDASMNVYQNLVGMYAKVYPAKPATNMNLPSDQLAERMQMLHQWVEIIKYEELNPIGLGMEEFVERVAFTFRSALIPFVYSNHLWYMYFQFMLLNNQKDKAITELRLAISNFLKQDGKLQFILAAYLDDEDEVASAATEFKRLVGPALKLIDENEPDKEEAQLKQVLQYDEASEGLCVAPIKLIHYLNYIRRNRGRIKWKEDLQVIFTKRELLSWELYWYVADTELRCFKDTESAVEILRRAQQGMPFSMHYTLLHLRFLLNIGRLVDVRMILTELIMDGNIVGENKLKLTPTEKLQLWRFWLHVEYFYGSKTQYAYVKSIFSAEKIANEVGLDPYVEKSKRSTDTGIRQIFSDVGAVFMRTHMDSTKRMATEEMNAIVDMRRRLFCAGLDFEELDDIFLLGTKTDSPVTSNVASSAHLEKASEPDPSNFVKAHSVTTAFKGRRVAVARPDVSAMKHFSPENTAVLEAQMTLHGSKRPALPTDGRPLDAVATPPKVLFDLLRVLPTPTRREAFPKMYSQHEAIEYLIYTLKSIPFEKISLSDYTPLPINQLLHLRSAASGARTEKPKIQNVIPEGPSGPNHGLFSVLQFVEDHICHQDDENYGMKRAAKKQQLAM